MKNWLKWVLPAEPITNTNTVSFHKETRTTKGWFGRKQIETIKNYMEVRQNGTARVILGIW
jgi:hypothetical protein